MRRIKIFFTLILFLVILSSCSQYSENETSQLEATQGTEADSVEAIEDESDAETESQTQAEPEADAGEVPEVVANLTTHYIRGGDSSTSDTVSTLIRTEEDYKEYCEKEKRFVSTKEFQAICGRFDQTFWENYDLLMVGRTESSGSIRHEVLTMTRGNGYWDVEVRYLIPTGQTADMAGWTFLIEVPEGLLKDEDVIRMAYMKDSARLGTETSYLRTDTWKPENGDEHWYLEERPQYFMDTKEDLETYCRAHPELSESFFEFCNQYDDEFWQKKDLLIVVQREESSSIGHEVGIMFRNGVLNGGTWFVELERQIPETLADDPAVWHFLIEVKSGELKEDDLIRIQEKTVTENGPMSD